MAESPLDTTAACVDMCDLLSMFSLPDDVLIHHILVCLPLCSVGICAFVCKRFTRLARVAMKLSLVAQDGRLGATCPSPIAEIYVSLCETGTVAMWRWFSSKGYHPWSSERAYQISYHFRHHTAQSDSDLWCLYASMQGNMKLLQEMFTRDDDDMPIEIIQHLDQISEGAASSGHIDIWDWAFLLRTALHDSGKLQAKDDHIGACIYEAAAGGHVDMIQHILERSPRRSRTMVRFWLRLCLLGASAGSQIAILDRFRERTLPFSSLSTGELEELTYRSVFGHASLTGQRGVLEWGIKHLISIDFDDCASQAASAGHADLTYWIAEQRQKCLSTTTEIKWNVNGYPSQGAASSGNLAFLKWLWSHSCPITKYTLLSALHGNHLDVANWLVVDRKVNLFDGSPIPWLRSLLADVTLETLKWMRKTYEHEDIWTTTVVGCAFADKRLDILDWALAEGLVVDTISDLELLLLEQWKLSRKSIVRIMEEIKWRNSRLPARFLEPANTKKPPFQL